MVTPGGEEAFVGKMMTESVMLGQRCRYVPPFVIASYCRILEFHSQMVHLNAWQAVISRSSCDTPAHSLSTLEFLAPIRFTLMR